LTNGVALFDLASGRELACLSLGPDGCGLCFDGSGNLLANSYGGFYRWPVQPDPASPDRLFVGPPERLPFQAGNRFISASRDGRVIAQSMWNGYGMPGGGWIMHPNFPTPRQVQATDSIGACSVSPDGHWVAFNGPHSRFTVYDAASAQPVWKLCGTLDIRGRFSSDGRWLATDADGGRLYTAGTWEPGPQLGPGTPWDITSELAVLGVKNGIYRLVKLPTGRELARLEDPEQNDGPAAFTPDGTKLVVVAKNGLCIWDLRRIRAELAKLDLDWEAPAYPPAANANPKELQVQVDLGDLAAHIARQTALQHTNLAGALRIQGKLDEAVAQFRKAIELDPKSAMAHNNLAWLLATCPEPQFRDPQRAVEFAKKSVELAPTEGSSWNTLGAAHYRAGNWRDAIAALEQSLKLQGDNSFDWFFLAMAHWQLGAKDQARKWYEKAVEWMDKNAKDNDELRRFRREAEELLEIKKK
jgi:hypothetical protein